MVSGTLGDAGAGLDFVKAPPRGVDRDAVDELVRRFEYPIPRVAMGLCARGIASAAMDLSDGLVGDLPKLAQASGLGAHVNVDRLPLSAALRAAVSGAQAVDMALAAGDDYELLLAVPPKRLGEIKTAADRLNLMLTEIGELHSGPGVTWSLNGKDFMPRVRGFDHFGGASTQITV